MEAYNDENYTQLVQIMRCTPRPLALLGAGVSVGSGYPDWNGLLAMMESRVPRISPKYTAYLRKLEDPAWAAEEYRRLMGEHMFRNLIASAFGPREQPNLLLNRIARLQFRHVLTTNYDPSIERAYSDAEIGLCVADWTETDDIKRFFSRLYRDGDCPYLVYLHGRYYDPANIVLTESSYAMRYVRSDETQRKLFAILITQPLVLIGFSVTDPDLNHLMREVNIRLGTGTHFAMIGYSLDDEYEFIKNRLERKYGIRPIFYRITHNPDGSENHDGLMRLIDQLYQDSFGKPMPLPPITEVATDDAVLPLPTDPLDLQKGKWGGKPERNGRRLYVADSIKCDEKKGVCRFRLVVESADDDGDPEPGSRSPLAGTVRFHLHQTFANRAYDVSVKKGKATTTITAYGAFTVGAEADNGATPLELDLAQVEAFPKWFREK